jgi:hypothetical protein
MAARNEAPIACSLGSADMSDRALEFGALGDRLLAVTRDEGRLTLSFTPGASMESQLLDLARKEAVCCPFLDLRVVAVDDVLKLELAGPSEAGPVLDAIQSMATGNR